MSLSLRVTWKVQEYPQAGLSLCWSHIPHCWKSYVVAHLLDHLIIRVAVSVPCYVCLFHLCSYVTLLISEVCLFVLLFYWLPVKHKYNNTCYIEKMIISLHATWDVKLYHFMLPGKHEYNITCGNIR